MTPERAKICRYPANHGPDSVVGEGQKPWIEVSIPETDEPATEPHPIDLAVYEGLRPSSPKIRP